MPQLCLKKSRKIFNRNVNHGNKMVAPIPRMKLQRGRIGKKKNVRLSSFPWTDRRPHPRNANELTAGYNCDINI
jgi:hypothetical protein